MKPTALISIIALAIIVISWKTFSGNSPADSKNPVPTAKEAIQTKAPLDTTILWDDFKTDSTEFDVLRKASPLVKNAKTVFVRYDIDKLITYLEYLKTQTVHGQNIDSVDLFLGKYVNANIQPVTGTVIPTTLKNKITVMFAGTGTSKESTPSVIPYNSGRPLP